MTKPKIYLDKNKHKSVKGFVLRLLYGPACLAEGVLNTLTLGMVHTNLPLVVAYAQVKHKRQEMSSKDHTDK